MAREQAWPPPPPPPLPRSPSARHKVTSTQDGGAHLVQTQPQPDGILSVGSTSKLTLTLRAPSKLDVKSAGELRTPTIHPFPMSRLVKKVLHSFLREKLPPTEKSFIPPPALKIPTSPLTGDPVTLAIIGGGQRGKARISLAHLSSSHRLS